MRISARVRITGPLTSFLDGFAVWLTAQGYTVLSVRKQLRLVAHLSRWLDEVGIGLPELSPARIAEFAKHRRRRYTGLVSEQAMRPILAHLRGLGVVPGAPSPQPRSGLLGRYEQYLVQERGLPVHRCAQYLMVADRFLEGREGARLSAADVTAFFATRAAQRGVQHWRSPLRSFLRFLFMDGITPLNLVYAVPSAPGWRHRSLPKALSKTELRAVLASCDRRTMIGCRDHAALLLMARLGLRAGEVASLSLDDFGWSRGDLVVHGKGGTLERLPLPQDVGQAVARYLRWRGHRDDTRTVFLLAVAPCRAATPATITCLARRALRAAGMLSGGAHRLRHTAATMMLRRGASMAEIAQVLRHRHIDTTAIYAKVDHDALRSVAVPWPAPDTTNVNALRTLAPAWPLVGDCR